MAISLLNWADDHGYFYADPAAIRSFARPFDDASTTTLGCLQQLLKIEYIDVHQHPTRGFIGRVSNFHEHQRVDKPKDSKIKKFFDESTSVIVLGSIQDESKTHPAGKEGKGKDSKRTKTKPSPQTPAEVLPQDSWHSRIKAMVQTAWSEHNESADCPWGVEDGAQLKLMRSKSPGWLDGQYSQCLANMYGSVGFPRSKLPFEFLPRLCSYLSGPRNEFNREQANGKKGELQERLDVTDRIEF
jgi:hypothetical protein